MQVGAGLIANLSGAFANNHQPTAPQTYNSGYAGVPQQPNPAITNSPLLNNVQTISNTL